MEAGSLQKATASSLCIFIVALPLTYVLGLLAHSPPSAKARQLLLYPIKGGKHHFILQVLAWAAWGASILVSLPVLVWILRTPAAGLVGPHTELLLGAACIGSVFAELFMIKSLLVFDPERPRPMPARQGSARRAGRVERVEAADDGDEDSEADVEPDGDGVDGSLPEPVSPTFRSSWLPSRVTASAAVVGMGVVWAAIGGVLLMATEYLESSTTKVVYFILSGACLLVAATTTHGLAGKLRHEARDTRRLSQSEWRFFQPFRGGKAFVATQALGWALFSVALACLIWLGAQVAAGMAYCIRCWVFATSSLMFFAQLVLGLSILVYKRKSRVVTQVKAAVTTPAAAASLWGVWLPVLLMYTPVHMFCVAVVLSLMIMPSATTLGTWVAGMAAYYLTTSMGRPEHTGSREWRGFRVWMARHLDAAMTAWLGNVEVVYTGKTPLDPAKKYVFGYAPHGLFPIGALYLPLLQAFRAAFPGVSVVSLVASVVFQAPVIRDLCMWCGVRQVARQTFVKALAERGAVVMVPGGQAELVHTWRLFRHREFVIYGHHKGFVRVALEAGAAVVPLLVLGEIDTLRNLWDLPDVQQWTYKKIGFPVPYIVVGRWGLSPLPQGRPVKFVIGQPIYPSRLALHPDGQVRMDVLDEVHSAFYNAVEALYREHAPSFPGYANTKLVMER